LAACGAIVVGAGLLSACHRDHDSVTVRETRSRPREVTVEKKTTERVSPSGNVTTETRTERTTR
jgi:hypothetical protein